MSTQDFSSDEPTTSAGVNLADAIVDLLEASIGPDLFDMWFNRGCIEVNEESTGRVVTAVSYTHLTLPTILLV